jgi:rhodanese-related sulfurtransferase
VGKKTSTKFLSIQDKYRLYEKAVQSPSYDVEFFTREFKKKYSKSPMVLREDFCGTGAISAAWVDSHREREAYGHDLDSEPLNYGLEHHRAALPEHAQKRLYYRKENVLAAKGKRPDVVMALNFSYFIFKKRPELLEYFRSVFKSLGGKGLFFLDIFGGLECHQPLEEKVVHKNFTYYWDCESFNPLTAECLYKIHFKKKSDSYKYRDVFVYDWRMWTVAELCDVLTEAGFKDVHTFWEGEDDDGGGDGNFFSTTPRKKKRIVVENCESWISYIVASPS